MLKPYLAFFQLWTIVSLQLMNLCDVLHFKISRYSYKWHASLLISMFRVLELVPGQTCRGVFSDVTRVESSVATNDRLQPVLSVHLPEDLVGTRSENFPWRCLVCHCARLPVSE